MPRYQHPLDGRRRHTLTPKAIIRKIPKLYSQENVEDPIVWLKLFSPYSGYRWYITEYDPGSQRAFGWVQGPGHGELGYIDLKELAGAEKRGLPLVERDLYWSPTNLSEILEKKVSHKKAFNKENPPNLLSQLIKVLAKEADQADGEGRDKLRDALQKIRSMTSTVESAWQDRKKI